MGLHTKLNVSKMYSQYANKGPQLYTDSGKLTSTFNHSADTFIQSDLNEDKSNQNNKIAMICKCCDKSRMA